MTTAAIKAALEQEQKEGVINVELAKITMGSLNDGQNNNPVNTNGSGGQDNDKVKNAEEEDDGNKQVVEVKQGCFRRCRAKCCQRDLHKKPVGFESNPNLRIKNTIKRIVNGRFVLTLMTFVTIFALIGDDVRLSATSKEYDIYFTVFLMISLILFTMEILASSVAIDDYKYSFYFYLDIVATLSIITDVQFLFDFFATIFGMTVSSESVNALPGVLHIENALNAKIQQVVKALRLIRLVRIIKLYKYIKQSMSKDVEEEQSDDEEEEEDEKERLESLFKRETDPSKLGKALSDRNTREVIIGVLLMLMILPLLTPTETDFAQEYGLREIFWMGRSNCVTEEKPEIERLDLPVHVDRDDIPIESSELTSFYCDMTDGEPWITSKGWIELLQMYVTASSIPEGSDHTWEVLWLYVPDYNKKGQMAEIPRIPAKGQTFDNMEAPYLWEQSQYCSGFIISDECEWRSEEMVLVTFKPDACTDGSLEGCEELVAYARIANMVLIQQTATFQIVITLFTCVVLAVAFIMFSHDTQVHVIIPIKKVVAIIQKLAESPLKKPELPTNEEDTNQMKTKMLEQTIHKIGTLLQKGFGELGASIISESLTQTDYGIDLSLPGKKVEIVYSICRIRQFTDTTECLHEEIIVFVNKIVRIIHLCSQHWDGKPTKNYGDRYMITWKLPSYEQAIEAKDSNSGELAQANMGSMQENGNYGSQNGGSGRNGDEDLFSKAAASQDASVNLSSKIDERTSLLPDGTVADKNNTSAQPFVKVEDGKIPSKVQPEEKGEGSDDFKENQPLTRQQIYAKREAVLDKALISAVKTLAQQQRAQDLMAYSRHPRIIKTFQDKYNISISFALHVGRAIEGAIGSEFKVDALYLSADTQIAQRIDSLCDTYDRQILLSGEFYKMLSDKGKTFCRKVDQISMEESRGQTKEVYCFDIYPSDPLEEEQKPEDDTPNGKFIRHMDYESQDITHLQARGIQYIYEIDHDFVCIKRGQQSRPEFYDFFQKALDNYIDGDWVNAQSNLQNCVVSNPTDGPMRWMTEYLEGHKNLAPESWKGVRDLEMKQQAPSSQDGFGLTTKQEDLAAVVQDANPDSPKEVMSPTSTQ